MSYDGLNYSAFEPIVKFYLQYLIVKTYSVARGTSPPSTIFQVPEKIDFKRVHP